MTSRVQGLHWSMVYPAFLSALLLVARLRKCTAAHVFYSAIGGDAQTFSEISNDLVWGPYNEPGNVFASNEFFFANGIMGYMGGQSLADGSHGIIFSIWDDCVRYGSTTCDYPRTTALPGSGCLRFGSEGHGVHCGARYAFDRAVPYRFSVRLGSKNATGRWVSAEVVPMAHNGTQRAGNATAIGSIFLLNTVDRKTGSKLAGYGLLSPYCRTFMEYWSHTTQTASFGWIGPHGNDGTAGPPLRAVADSAEGLPVVVDRCIPNRGCARGQVFFNASTDLAVLGHGLVLPDGRNISVPHPERVDGGYWLDVWADDTRAKQRNPEACAWCRDTNLQGNCRFFC